MALDKPDARSRLRHAVNNKRLVVNFFEHRMSTKPHLMPGLAPVLLDEIGLLNELESLQQDLPDDLNASIARQVEDLVASVEKRSQVNQQRAAAVLRR